MKKLIAFDLDGTLAESKQPATTEMAELLRQLLGRYQVAIIGGGAHQLFKEQLLDHFEASVDLLKNLHILPTNGARYLRYQNDSWQEVYAHEIPAAAKPKIFRVIEECAKELGYWETKTWGEIIEDRGTQISFSGLGQNVVKELGDEGLKMKAAWDPDNTKKRKLRDAIAARLPEFSVKAGGLSTVDVTLPNINKATVLNELINQLGISKDEAVYIGDALYSGGNDAIVKEAGFETIGVKGPVDTAKEIQKLLA